MTKSLKKELINLPTCGTLNVHPSLLPKYRGASPVEGQILDDAKVVGVTIMEMDEEHGGGNDGLAGLDDLLAAPELHDDYFANHLRPINTEPPQQYQDQQAYHMDQQQQQQYYDGGDYYDDGGMGGNDQYIAPQYNQGQVEDVSMMSTYSEISPAGRKPMVYGDHRRRQQQQQQYQQQSGYIEGDMQFQDAQLQPSSWMDDGKNLPPLTHEQQQHIVEEQFIPASPSLSQGFSPRPSSSMTDSSEVTNDYQQNYRQQPQISTDGYGGYTGYGGMPVATSNTVSPEQRKAKKEDDISKEWGINDPKVLAMMMKRSKKIKAGAGTSGASARQRAIPSSSFGGKPKMSKPKPSNKKNDRPAWAKPEN